MKSESMWKLHRAMTLSLASKMKASTAAKNKPLGFKWTNLWHPFLTSIMKEMQVLSWEKSTGRC